MTTGEKRWKRMGMLARLFLRHAETWFVAMAQQMYPDRKLQDMARVVYGSSPPTSQSSGDQARSPSGHRAVSKNQDWMKEFGYGLPMSRRLPNSCIRDPDHRRQWPKEVSECEHEKGSVQIFGSKATTYNNHPCCAGNVVNDGRGFL